MSIIGDPDTIIIDFCDLETDYKNLSMVNNRFYNLITKNNELFVQWKNISKWNDLVSSFVSSCELGLQLLAKYYIRKYNVDINALDALFHSCRTGQIEIAKYLINLYDQSGYTPIDIHAHKEWIFGNCCIAGNIEAAKYLISLSAQPRYMKIDLHVGNEKIFIDSCRNGHIEIVKCLIDLSTQSGYTQINIHARNDLAFRSSCEKGHIQVAKYLIFLGNQPGYTPIDNEIIEKYMQQFNILQ